MSFLRSFVGSMTSRIFLILLVGVALSATTAWSLADSKRQADLRRLDGERAIDKIQEIVERWQGSPGGSLSSVISEGRWDGVREAPPDAHGIARDQDLTNWLHDRLPRLDVYAEQAGLAQCRPAGFPHRGAVAGARRRGAQTRLCWVVTINKDGSSFKLLVDSPPRPRGAPLLFDPLYLGVLGIAAAALALIVARTAAAPLLSLSNAAAALGDDLARNPLPITGPTELRNAARIFNAMQSQLQRQLAERTHILAAITHDLQTPVTRLRLRLDKVEDVDLRDRLLNDLAAMNTLIREGLEFARTADRTEARVRADLLSLVNSLVEDAADAGQAVSLVGSCNVTLEIMPDALRRCLSNLIDNALKYGGQAEVSVAVEDGSPVIRIRDHGPGLPEEALATVFEPFVRLETSRSRETGGVGLGLTIARTLADRNGATITLRNHPGGGAESIVRFGFSGGAPKPKSRSKK